MLSQLLVPRSGPAKRAVGRQSIENPGGGSDTSSCLRDEQAEAEVQDHTGAVDVMSPIRFISGPGMTSQCRGVTQSTSNSALHCR